MLASREGLPTTLTGLVFGEGVDRADRKTSWILSVVISDVSLSSVTSVVSVGGCGNGDKIVTLRTFPPCFEVLEIVTCCG